MNIRTANENDKKQLYSLWNEAFGDSDEVIDMFYKSVIKADNTVLAEEDGRVISALYLIKAEITVNKKDYKAYYIYAAATDKKYRRRGVMGKLLEFCSALSEKRNVDYLFLHPETEKLYSYYAKNGFVTAFYENNGSHDGVVKWGKEVISLDRMLNEGETTEEKTDDKPRKTGMIKRTNANAPEVQNALMGITLE